MRMLKLLQCFLWFQLSPVPVTATGVLLDVDRSTKALKLTGVLYKNFQVYGVALSKPDGAFRAAFEGIVRKSGSSFSLSHTLK